MIRVADEQEQSRRDHGPANAGKLTATQLEQAWRDLRASLALTQPGSPLRGTILARLAVINERLIELPQERDADDAS